MRALIGLGNPGEEYEKTRHNAGFWLVDAVAQELGAGGWRSQKDGLLCKVEAGGAKALLFKPQLFMNRSGQPIRAFLDYYKIAPADLCIAADDVYVEPGSARVRRSGGDGGHNGWKSVLEHVEADDFWRVRIGVGLYEQHPQKRMHQPALDDYVLQPLPAADHKRTVDMIDRLVPKLVEWLANGGLEEETFHV